MKVLHVYKGYYPDEYGGVCEFIRQLAYGTNILGVKNSLLVLTDNKKAPETELVNGLRVYWCQSDFIAASTPISLKAIGVFKQLANQNDIIHYHYPYPFADILDCFISKQNKKVVTYHSDIIKQKYLAKFYKPLRDKFLNNVDTIIATSPNYLLTSDTLKKFQEKVEVITIGLFPELYPETSDQYIQAWSKKYEESFFLFIGATRYYKALHILIKASKLNNLPVLVIGGGVEQPKYIKLAAKLQADNVHFLGKLSEDNKTALLHLCHALILPSHQRSEALGISLIEGAMHGKPLISCEIGTGTTYVNIANKTGLVVPPGDPYALSDAMQYLWDNPNEAIIMGINSSRRYHDIFTGDRMSEAYYSVYSSVMEK